MTAITPIHCGVARPSRGDGPCDGPVAFEVVVWNGDKSKVFSRTPACFRHGLAETDRAARAGGMAWTEMVPAPAPGGKTP